RFIVCAGVMFRCRLPLKCEVRGMTRRLLAALAVVISTLLLVAASWAWVAGYYWQYPHEVRRLGIYYSPADSEKGISTFMPLWPVSLPRS
ncbi:MAG TPA: hypothetical protein VGI81_04240, partial [Tepidisphaeraceae bacterium]